jgi:hypothetical protein
MHRILALVVIAGCTAGQVRTAKRAGEITAGAALCAMLATVLVAEAWPAHHTEFLDAGFVLVPITILGAGVYVAADAAQGPEPVRSEHSASWNAAMTLAKQAKHAARAGDCAEVQAIEPRVRDLDPDVYLRFVSDKVIRPCLGPR